MRPNGHARLPHLTISGEWKWKQKNARVITVTQEWGTWGDTKNKLEEIELSFHGKMNDIAHLSVEEARALGCWLIAATQPNKK